LTASRIDLEAGVATVSGKTGERRVMIPEAARAILEAQMKRWPEGPIMRNTKGKPWRDNAISAQMMRARGRVGIKGVVTYHVCGAFAICAIKNGVPSLLVSKLLGHSDPRIVAKFYEQLDEGDLKDAAERASQTTTPGSTSSSAPKPDA
jgi:integrase